MVTNVSSAPVATLLENHRAFLRYLERRVGDRSMAEDILQDVFAKVVARPDQAPADESVIPWFYRTLRNAAVDQFRRRGAADRAYNSFARELETHELPTGEMEAEICACVSRLAATLKPEYAEAGHRGRRHTSEDIRAAEGPDIQQRGRAGLSCTGSSQEASDRVVRDLRRTWMQGLHLQTALVAGAHRCLVQQDFNFAAPKCPRPGAALRVVKEYKARVVNRHTGFSAARM